MTTTTQKHDTRPADALYLALELGAKSWKLAFTVGLGQSARIKTVPAGGLRQLHREIKEAKQRFALAPQAPVFTCYEAGRDGFWIHRAIQEAGIVNLVVDSSSIEVDRRKRRAKTDKLDATKLVEMLVRYHLGQHKVWRIVQVPTPAQEDARHLHREIEILQHERRQLANRIAGLLTAVGVNTKVNTKFGQQLEELKLYNGEPLGPELVSRLKREFARWEVVHQQLQEAEREMVRRTKAEAATNGAMQCLLSMRGIGPKSTWIFMREGLVWRKFRNRREVASMVGLVPTPYHSGKSSREQGISKAGNARLRKMLVELAWSWLRYQPFSALTEWYITRFHCGNNRSRKVGIVALARKLLVALWRLATTGEIPQGADYVDWTTKFKQRGKTAA